MKKYLPLFLLIALSFNVKAQGQLSTIHGKTKDGKTVKVEYYHGALEDYIETVKYQVVDELQARVKNLQNDNKELQGKLDAANKKVNQLQRQLEQGYSNTDNEKTKRELTQVQNTVNLLNDSIAKLQSRINTLETEKSQLTATINAMNAEKAAPVAQEPEAPERNSIIGFTAGAGPVFLDYDLNNQWHRDAKTSTQFTLYYGSPRLFQGFPLSVEAGVNYYHFTMMAHKNAESNESISENLMHIQYNVISTHTLLTEQLDLSYIGIPIRVCFGQPVKGNTTVYAKIGITPSFCIQSTFEGDGKYSKSGYFPEWGVTLEDFPALGFVNDKECYEDVETTVNPFTIWGNLSVGACVPLGKSHWQFNAGITVDYPFMRLGEAVKTDAIPDSGGLFNKGGKELIPGINLGIVYTL